MGPSAPSRKPNNRPFWGGKLATCPSNKGGGPPVRRCEFGERPKRGGCEGSPKGRSDRSGRPHPAMDRLKNPNQRHQEPKPTPSKTPTTNNKTPTQKRRTQSPPTNSQSRRKDSAIYRPKANHPIIPYFAHQLPLIIQSMKVRQRLAHRKRQLMRIQSALEHDRNNIRRRTG